MNADSPRARRSDPETSHEAADTTDLTGSQSWVLFLLRTHGPMDELHTTNNKKGPREAGAATRKLGASRVDGHATAAAVRGR